MRFDRQNKNLITSWWWTVDRVALFAILGVIALGALLVATASPSIAERIGLDSFHFIKRQIIFLTVSVGLILGTSMLPTLAIRRLSAIGFVGGIVLLLAVFAFGDEVKGAKRWLYLGGFSLQPSEFMKPLFIVVTAWMLSEAKIRKDFAGVKIACVLYAVLAGLLILQPDFGMTVVVSAVWAGQMFLSGLSLAWIIGIVVISIVGVLLAYSFLPHVARRIDSFLGNDGLDTNYQVQKSLEAFDSGGIFGRGPGEGVVKAHLPDSHTDFIFAVAGEEMGALLCVIIVCLYAFIVIRGMLRMLNENDLFTVYATAGLLMQFGIQAIINMGVALNLLPTKGMTLPFISYGGSSMMALALGIGMMLALTRRRYGVLKYKPLQIAI